VQKVTSLSGELLSESPESVQCAITGPCLRMRLYIRCSFH